MAQNKAQYNFRTLDLDQKIVQSIDNGIVVLDDNLYIYHYNRWLELHTGKKESQVLHKKLNEVFQEINSKTLIRKIKTALRLQTPTFYIASTSKYLIPIKLNQIKHTHFKYMQQDISIVPFDKENNLVALIITDQTIMATTNAMLNANIEEVKKLNAELIKERDTIDKKILYIKFDIHNIITDVSHALLELLSFQKEDLKGLNFFQYEKLHINKGTQKSILESMQKLQVLHFEESTLSLKGEELLFKSTLVPEYNAKGEHIGFILFRENVTDAKKLAQTKDKILASSRSAAMGEMIAMIAHQWRQPLSLINTVIATMKIKKELDILDEEVINKSFEKIQTTTKYLSETIDDFRDYFKPNKLITEFALESLFDKSIFFLKEEMAQYNIEYKIVYSESIKIATYKNELLQTLINVLKNSIDAFEKLEIDNKTITVTITNLATHISIEIEDNAGGIDKQTLSRVFEPYFSTKSKNGTGLGLYMCHSIITEHLKGSIIIQSKDFTTKVVIELPYKIKEKK